MTSAFTHPAPTDIPNSDEVGPLDTDAQILDHAGSLLSTAIRRQTWLLFLDDDNLPVPLLIPIDGFPRVPGPEGALPFVSNLTREGLGIDGLSMIVVWERPGGEALSNDEKAWVTGFADAFAELARTDGLRNRPTLRAQLLLHDAGVRWISAGELR